MKAFIVLAIVCLARNTWATPLQLTEEQKAEVSVHFAECIKQENVSEQDATRLRNKDFANPTTSMKCFGTCFFEQVGILKADKVQEEVVLKKVGPLIGEDMTKAVLSKCKDVKGTDRCETGFKIYECFETFKSEKTN